MPPLLADFIYNRVCELKCEKFLTRPNARREKIRELLQMANIGSMADIQDIYGISVSDYTVSRITDKILPVAKEWQQRPLEPIYAVVFLDATHCPQQRADCEESSVHCYWSHLDGWKDFLGMWVGENESAKFWATVLNSMKSRGVEDIFIACTDNLAGFDTTIHATFPQAQIQNCIIRQLRKVTKSKNEGP